MESYRHNNVRESKSWHDMYDHVSTWTDRLGRPIDHGIHDTVIALNLLGFPTTASCEGHDDHGTPAPWVAVRVERGEDMEHGVLLASSVRSRIDRLLDDYYTTTYMPERLMIRTGIVWHYDLDLPSAVRLSVNEPQPEDLAVVQADMRGFTDFLVQLIDTEQY